MNVIPETRHVRIKLDIYVMSLKRCFKTNIQSKGPKLILSSYLVLIL